MTTSTAEPTPAHQSPKSTGSILDLSERQVSGHCEKHGGFIGTERTWAGRVFRANCPQCETVRKQAEREALIRERLSRTGIPERFLSRTFDNYRAENDGQRFALQVARTYAERFDDRLRFGGGLIFSGKPGTGKTHLAAAIGNHVTRQGRTVLFSTFMQAVRGVKDTYQPGVKITEQQAYRALIAPDLLILDEIGMQRGTQDEKLIAFEVINGRYERQRPTIILSNYTEPEIADYLGSRVMDRLKEGGSVLVPFGWESYRARVHKDDQLPGRNVPDAKWGE